MRHQTSTVEARLAELAARSHGVVTRAQLLGMLSGRAAFHVWGLLKGAAPPPEVTTPYERRVPRVTTHRARNIERTTHRGIPVTTVPRTLVDLAGHLSLDDLARACHEAGVKYDTTPSQVEATLARRPKTTGAAALKEILKAVLAHRGITYRRVHSITYLLGLLEDHDVPPPPRAAELETLTPWAPQARYDHDTDDAVLDRQAAVELVAAVRAWAEAVVL